LFWTYTQQRFHSFIHSDEHHKHEHKHGHDDHCCGGKNEEADDTPEWKKQALASGNSDPTAAPFGGNWTSESNVDASAAEKMEE
jgi:hypothetical protein